MRIDVKEMQSTYKVCVYTCEVCGKEYGAEFEAKSCERGHCGHENTALYFHDYDILEICDKCGYTVNDFNLDGIEWSQKDLKKILALREKYLP
jgi:hypothetical protein